MKTVKVKSYTKKKVKKKYKPIKVKKYVKFVHDGKTVSFPVKQMSSKEYEKFEVQNRIGVFPKNMQRLNDGDKEVFRTVLNNGFFTIAHNYRYEDKDRWIKVFRKIGASEDFIEKLDLMFESNEGYYDPATTDWEEKEEIMEASWEEMQSYSKTLDRLAKQEDLYAMMSKEINW